MRWFGISTSSRRGTSPRGSSRAACDAGSTVPLIDVGSYEVGRRGLAPPDSSRAILYGLENDGALPAGTAERFAPLFAFRNRVVHLYDRVDARRVYEILTEHRQDILELLDLLLAIPD